jgi:hypothetical protein
MTGNEAAAWAQAIMSGGAVLVAAAAPVWQQAVRDKREARSRLQVITQQMPGDAHHPGPLGVTVIYHPKELHQAILARVKLPFGTDLNLYSGRRIERAKGSKFWRLEEAGDEGEAVLEIVLQPSRAPDEYGRFVGVFIVSGNWRHKYPQSTKLQVTVLTQIEREVLDDRSITSSAVDYVHRVITPY